MYLTYCTVQMTRYEIFQERSMKSTKIGCIKPNTSPNYSKGKGKFTYSAVSNPQGCSKRFTLYSLADLFNRTPSRPLWEAFSHVTINSQKLLVHIHSSLSIARYSFTQLSELEQCRVKKNLSMVSQSSTGFEHGSR